MRFILVYGIIALVCLCSCTKKEEYLYTYLSPSDTGLQFKNNLSNSTELNILNYLYYYNGAGVAAGDFNNDGMPDLYFTANEGPDKLFLNQGGFQFKDITEIAGIDNKDGWTTGVTHVDINNDGFLDIYVSKVANYLHLRGHNLLYINQGADDSGIPVFREAAAEYGLDFSGLSTQAAFFDYDLDGDLDMYLLNHSVHPNRTYGKGAQRSEPDSLAGDRLFANEGGKFTDVSRQAGLFQGRIGYGLGLATGDLNNDGYPDLYIGNDFFENDYLYLNQKDGSFREIISSGEGKMGHTTHYSMGNTMQDLNNDGRLDILSLDMLPEDLQTFKTSGFEYAYPTYEYYLNNGYHPQYMQNTLQLNLGEGRFSDVGHLSGIAATEWSWAPLAADFDNDGDSDIFISNGIRGATNDMDFINFIANEQIQKRLGQGITEAEMEFIKSIPEKKVANYFFENRNGLRFENVSGKWLAPRDSFSNGATYVDLDDDGDLDIVVNNVDSEAYILKNNLMEKNQHGNYLKLQFEGPGSNRQGLGARIIAYNDGSLQLAENFPSKGYLSAVPNGIHLGLGTKSHLDSLLVIWPGGQYEMRENLQAGRTILLNFADSEGNYYDKALTQVKNFLEVADSLVPFVHRESSTIEFNRDPLVPYVSTNEGPGTAVADVNGDGLDDFFIGGAKHQPSALFLQLPDGSFRQSQQSLFEADAASEDISQVFFNANGDTFPDLLVVSGGNEYKSGAPLRPRLYLNKSGTFTKDSLQFASVEINASKVSNMDFDRDGDQDIVMVSDQVPWSFGLSPQHYIFQNDGKGNFIDVTDTTSRGFRNLGNIKDLHWADLDGNGYQDLIVAGHWMPLTLLMNNGSTLEIQTDNGLEDTSGWWNAVKVADFDLDGDLDLVAGNWGENSKLTASTEKPLTLYRFDFDFNGTVEPLVTYYHKDTETPFASKDELSKQMPFLNKKYLSYKSFAEADLAGLFSVEYLEKAMKKQVTTLESAYFVNQGNGTYTQKPLPDYAQASTVQDMEIMDFNRDGYPDLMLVGNTYEISTQLGRMDAFHGVFLQNDTRGGFTWLPRPPVYISGPGREINKIRIGGILHYLVTINNNAPIFLKQTAD